MMQLTDQWSDEKLGGHVQWTDEETAEHFQIFTDILGDSSGLRKEDFRKIQGLFKTAMANCSS